MRWQSPNRGTDVTDQGYFHWSAAHAFTQDEGTVHDALPSLARQAYEEMIEDAENQGIDSRRVPSTMAALAVGTDVYFSSSLRGGPFLLTPGTPNGVDTGAAEEVATAIVRCQQSYNSEHRYGLACAEPLAIQQFLVNNQQITIAGQGKVSTYGNLNKDDPEDVGILNPCNVDRAGKWGCQVFIDKLRITRVGNQGDHPDLPSIQPAKDLPHCFWSNPEQ